MIAMRHNPEEDGQSAGYKNWNYKRLKKRHH
jgi:hypothetical protein